MPLAPPIDERMLESRETATIAALLALRELPAERLGRLFTHPAFHEALKMQERYFQSLIIKERVQR